MATTASTENLPLFNWARRNSASTILKEYNEANNALSAAETELYEANLSYNTRRMTRASDRHYAAQARFESAKKALRQH